MLWLGDAVSGGGVGPAHPPPVRLEIRQAVTLGRRQGAGAVRDLGDQLRVVRVGRGRYSQRGLAIAGADTTIPLPFFSVREVRRQCLAAGWSFAGRR
jgi:hypothetical protein